jgi:hypothetical protein
MLPALAGCAETDMPSDAQAGESSAGDSSGGGSSGGGSSGGGSSGGGSSGGGSSGGGSSGGGSSGGGSSDAGLAWAPWGPADPGDPPPYQWYGLLERHDCQGLHDSLASESPALWRGLAAVCSAAIDGDQSQWGAAERAAEQVEFDPSAPACLEQAATALLRRAVDWHERNPDRQPDIRFPAAGSETACAFRIERVFVLDDSEQPTDLPLEGPVTGGTLLQLEGQGIDNPEEVIVAGQPAEIYDDARLIVRTQAVSEPSTGQIRLRNRAGEVVASVQFRYVADSTSKDGGEETDPSGQETDPSGEKTGPNSEETDPNGEETDPNPEGTEPEGADEDSDA